MSRSLVRGCVAGATSLALAAALVGLTTTPSQAATQSVTITSTGYVPRDFTVAVGDTVTYTNADSKAHEVRFSPSTGVTCSPQPFALQPQQQASCRFTEAGRFVATDPNGSGNTFRSVITVTAAPTPSPSLTPTASPLQSVTLRSSAGTVVFGRAVTLAGRINASQGGVAVEIQAKETSDSAFTKIGTATTASDGSYSFRVSPRIRTEYRAHAVDGSRTADSGLETVSVRPRVTLAVRYIRAHSAGFRTAVRALTSHAGKRLLVQRLSLSGRWATVRTVTLGQFSAVSFAVRVPARTTRWRVVLPAAQANPGYISGFSVTKRIAH